MRNILRGVGMALALILILGGTVLAITPSQTYPEEKVCQAVLEVIKDTEYICDREVTAHHFVWLDTQRNVMTITIDFVNDEEISVAEREFINRTIQRLAQRHLVQFYWIWEKGVNVEVIIV